MKTDLYVLSAKRTAVGTFMGSLKTHGPVELGTIAAKAAIESAGVKTDDFIHSVFGNVCSSSSADAPYLSRHIALRSGLPLHVGSLTLNRLCGSGFEAIVQAQQWVGEGLCLVGGAENMSLTPLLIRNAREGFRFAQPPATVDSLWEALNDKYAEMSMGQTAENLAQEFSISREDCDQWAYNSHKRASTAQKEGLFDNEIVPVELKKEVFSKDEHIRHDSSLEKLAKLRPVFGGVTTAGNASGMNDAGAALVVASEDYVKSSGKKPMAQIIGARAVGCDPKRMGIGPVEAVNKLLDEVGWKMAELDYLEINEAFAAQILAVKKALKLSDEQLNPHGSGISLGHPLGATGARISTHICHLIESGRVKKAIGGACIGGGQGIAVAFESISA
jgi:acetyl-CoA acetyltransferase family protein